MIALVAKAGLVASGSIGTRNLGINVQSAMRLDRNRDTERDIETQRPRERDTDTERDRHRESENEHENRS